MTIQTVKFGRERFVLLREKDFRALKAKADSGSQSRKSRRFSSQDRGDVAEAMRRLSDPKEKPIPYTQARKELGLT